MSSAIGQDWERTIKQELDVLARLGQARIVRTTPPMVAKRRGGASNKNALQAYHIAGATSVDFDGHLIGSGRRICFEAKATQDESGFHISLLSDKQIEHLSQLAADGCIAFVYVHRAGVRNQRYLLPVDAKGRIAGAAHRRSPSLLTPDEKSRDLLPWDELEEKKMMVRPQHSLVDHIRANHLFGDG
jgi:penicillin-binding protein-related factor A (putative recombinase)